MAKTYTYPLEIKEFHLDTFGHVNHATYLQICEEARWQICTEYNIGLDHIHKTKIGPVILEAKIKYKKELKNREKIKIATEFSIARENFIGIKHLIYKENGLVGAEVQILAAMFDLNTRKIVAPPPEWQKAFDV